MCQKKLQAAEGESQVEKGEVATLADIPPDAPWGLLKLEAEHSAIWGLCDQDYQIQGGLGSWGISQTLRSLSVCAHVLALVPELPEWTLSWLVDSLPLTVSQTTTKCSEAVVNPIPHFRKKNWSKTKGDRSIPPQCLQKPSGEPQRGICFYLFSGVSIAE